jgi:hypothetical protein
LAHSLDDGAATDAYLARMYLFRCSLWLQLPCVEP